MLTRCPTCNEWDDAFGCKPSEGICNNKILNMQSRITSLESALAERDRTIEGLASGDMIEWATLLWDWECADSFSIVRHDYDHPWSVAAKGQPTEWARRQTALNICKRILEAGGVKVEPHGKDVQLTQPLTPVPGGEG